MRGRVTLVAVAAVATGVFLVTVPLFRHFFDLGVYRGAVRFWLLDGGGLYDFRYQGTAYGFTYPPFAALVFSPLALTSWPVAVAASVAANAAAVVVILRWWLRGAGWFVMALAFLAVLVLEPVRDTFSFGQVNLLLLVLVCADLRVLERGGRWAGVGIGVATAIKLTPAVFILYLLITRRFRAAATATGTAVSATVLAAVVAPDASRFFWTEAVWDTGRVGRLAYVSNQSLRGVVARLEAPEIWWAALVAAALACWFFRVRRSDPAEGFAATGALACLLSPVTWVHHLVWLLPALLLLPRRGVRAALWVALSSSVVWLWWADTSGPVAALGANAYVWITVFLMLTPLANGSSFTAMRLQTAQGALAYDDSGSGPLVICLPGMGDNRTTFRHLAPLLVTAGHRVVTLDPRGQGESDTAWPDYSPEATADDTLELLRHLDAGPALLVANSYTAASAVRAAALAPDLISGIVLTGPFARQMPKPNPALRAVLAVMGRVRPLWMAYWATLSKNRPADFAEARRRLSAELAQPGRMAVLRAQFAADKSGCEALLESVSVPALVVMGTRDPDFPDPAAEARLLAGRLRGTVTMIEGAGHYPQAEFPAETAAAVLSLSTGLGAGDGGVTKLAG